MMLLGIVAYLLISAGHGVGMYETYPEDGVLCAIWWGALWPVRILYGVGYWVGGR